MKLGIYDVDEAVCPVCGKAISRLEYRLDTSSYGYIEKGCGDWVSEELDFDSDEEHTTRYFCPECCSMLTSDSEEAERFVIEFMKCEY